MFKDEINRLEAEMTELQLQNAGVKVFLREVGGQIAGVTTSVNNLQRQLDGIIATIYELESAIQYLSQKMRHNENNQENSLYSELLRKQDLKKIDKNDIESLLTTKRDRLSNLKREQTNFDRLEISNTIQSGQIENELSILKEKQAWYEEQTRTHSYRRP